jgi:hypothetical protein
MELEIWWQKQHANIKPLDKSYFADTLSSTKKAKR